MKNNTELQLCSGDSIGSCLTKIGSRIHRAFPQGQSDRMKRIVALYEELQLARHGVIDTEADLKNCVLSHTALPISYPFEWCPGMLRDAALLQLSLSTELLKHGLTLKDALPENILFYRGKPVFVDFASLVSIDELASEEWLARGERDSTALLMKVLTSMFVPYVLIPLYLHTIGRHVEACRILKKSYCNNTAGQVADWKLALRCALSTLKRSSSAGQMRRAISNLALLWRLRRLTHGRPASYAQRLDYLQACVKQMHPGAVKSGYTGYYQSKGEAHSLTDRQNWETKQCEVDLIVREVRPTTVLDLGSNTGWFSKLAASHGAEVFACDSDMACVEALYNDVRQHGLLITPVWSSFDELSHESYSLREDGTIHDCPIHLAAETRFKSELVLVLGLVHHLVLGGGREYETVVKQVRRVTGKCAVFEFVSLMDQLIVEEPTFFPCLRKWDESSYNLQIFEAICRKYFSEVSIRPSHPDTRSLVVCSV